MKIAELLTEGREYAMHVTHGGTTRERKLPERALIALNPAFMSHALKKRATKLEVDGILRFSSTDETGKSTITVTRTK